MSTMLRFVTITGADDGVDPRALPDLSARFPFVEWGILQSQKRMGEPRYPSVDWLMRFHEVCLKGPRPVRHALHICGQLARDAYAGDARILNGVPDGVRVQINGLLPTPKEWARNNPSPLQRLGARFHRTEIILQCGGPQTLGVAGIMSEESPNFTALIDASGGRGIPIALPLPSWTGLARDVVRGVGYAGGITPETVPFVLSHVMARGRPFWIDMESGVRTNDRFDIAKVENALAAAEPFWRASMKTSESATPAEDPVKP